jgi:DUF1680 family protein
LRAITFKNTISFFGDDIRKLLGKLALSLVVLSIISASSGSLLRGQDSGLVKRVVFKAHPFDLKHVRLLPGSMKDLLERNRKYLLSLSVDRLVHNFRVNAGLPSKAEPLGGWEAPACELRGHFTGHYLTACALMYAATSDDAVRNKANQVVSALAACQTALGSSGYLSAYPEEFIERVETGKRVWAPWYTLHKIYAGLLDMYTMCGNEEALTVVTKMAAWAKRRSDKLDEQQMQNMLKVEFGGMAEVFANLFSVTRDSAHLALGRRFEKRSFLDPLIAHRDQLKGIHVNTHIPQVIGSARLYELTGEQPYYEEATYFWNQVVSARSYATGGTSNYEYWREEPHRLADQLSQETHENCCTYNMLRLTEHLYAWSGDSRLFDYYERALFSGILPTHHPEVGGAIMYYVPLKSGLFKMFGVPDSSYFCCNGSGIESFAKLGGNIYHRDDEGILVNLFIPSELKWTEKGITVRQTTRFPEDEGTSIVVRLTEPKEFALRIRIPSWVAKKPTLRVNGKSEPVHMNSSGYAVLKRLWHDRDSIELSLPMELSLSRMPDDQNVAAILYGPVVLAGALGREALTKEMENGLGWADVDRMVSMGAAVETPSLVPQEKKLSAWIKPVKGKPMTFRTSGAGKPSDITLIPFYKMFGQRYAVYWNLYSQREWDSLLSTRPAFPTGVTDRVIVGDNRSHNEHNFQAYRFQSGERQGKNWIRSHLWFRYDMNVLPSSLNVLSCTFWGGDTSSFEILIDGQRLKSESLPGGKTGEFVKTEYDIPPDFISGKKRVAVMFRAKENKPTAELYECAVLRKNH